MSVKQNGTKEGTRETDNGESCALAAGGGREESRLGGANRITMGCTGDDRA